MSNYQNSSNEYISSESAHSKQRATVLAALARIIARTHLSKIAADKNGFIEITQPNSQGNSVNNISNGDGSQL